MNEETREQIALARYKIISPVLAEPGRAQNAYLRQQAEREHLMPHYGARKFAMSSFKSWLRKYQVDGFDALKPKKRADRGRPRRLSDENMAIIETRCKAYPYLTIQLLYEQLLKEDQLGDPPIGYNNLVRIVRQRDLLPGRRRKDTRKRFETGAVNELWVGDFMHGPMVRTDRKRAKAILCAVIDDHSRMIVAHAFAASETVASLTVVLKEAFEAFGLPKRFYVDYVPRNIINVLCPIPLCAEQHESSRGRATILAQATELGHITADQQTAASHGKMFLFPFGKEASHAREILQEAHHH